MAEPVQDMRCFTTIPPPYERYYIYDVLLQILEALGGGSDCLSIQGCETQEFPVKVDLSGGGVAQTVSRSVVSASGSVAAGATSVTILSSSDFSGTVAGAAFSASIAENFTAQPGSTLAAIAYTRSAGTLTISKIV